jgi:hypothetical protein
LLIGGNAASSWRALAKSNASVSRRRHDHGLAGSDFAADLPAGQRFFVKGETFVGLLVSCSAGLTHASLCCRGPIGCHRLAKAATTASKRPRFMVP